MVSIRSTPFRAATTFGKISSARTPGFWNWSRVAPMSSSRNSGGAGTTGSFAASLPGIRDDGPQVMHSDEALELNAIPKSMLVIGDATAGLQLAHKASHQGIVAAEVAAGRDAHATSSQPS
jgi:hypothetical protein